MAVSVPRVQSEWCFDKEREGDSEMDGETENETGD